SVIRDTSAAMCIMHMQGTPQTMQDNPRYGNVVGEVFAFLLKKRDSLLAAGIPQAKICLDPGIGFGKTSEHNIELLAHCWRLHELGCPVLVGHSRKSFLNHFHVREASPHGDNIRSAAETDRTVSTIGVSCALAAQGVQILRVHDVSQMRQALEVF